MTKRNENRPGYKKTKVGWIPDDWDIKPLRLLGAFSKGKGISNSEKIESGLPCITYGEIYTKHEFVIKNFYSFIDLNSSHKSRRIKKDDILFAGSGETLDEIGKCVTFTKEFEAYAGGDIIIFTPYNANSIYLSYLLNSNFIARYRRKLGQGHSVVHIYSSSLEKLQLPLPPLPEQKKIAEILSAWDRAIEQTQELIEAKQKLKKGLMQQLLTGRIRFPEFGEPVKEKGEIPKGWREVRLGSICKKIKGFKVNTNENQKGIPYIGSASFNGKYFEYTENSNGVRCFKNDILLLWDGEYAGKTSIGHNGVASSTVAVLKFNENKTETTFVHNLLSLFNTKIRAIREGSGIPHLPGDFLHWFKIYLPKINEQSKISTILLIVDNEIIKLHDKKDNLNKQKKGLMQKLLTGEVRGKVN